MGLYHPSEHEFPSEVPTPTVEAPSVDFTVADKLDEARGLIEGEGRWSQNVYFSRAGGCFCTVGALAMATDGSGWPQDAVSATFHNAISLLAKVVGVHANWSRVSAWNDGEGRTQAEVIAAFRKAADLARAEMLA